jgi:hypothetical protein
MFEFSFGVNGEWQCWPWLGEKILFEFFCENVGISEFSLKNRRRVYAF